jgi:hypothetical protein
MLVPALTRRGVDLATLAIDVREEVARAARDAGYVQRPAYYDETTGGRVYLNGAPPAEGAASPRTITEVAPVWDAVKSTTNIAALDDFIREFGDVPVYGPLARARRDELAKDELKSKEKANQDVARAESRHIEDSLNQQQADLELAQTQWHQLGCGPVLPLLSLLFEQPAQCRPLGARITRIRADLDRTMADLERLAGEGESPNEPPPAADRPQSTLAAPPVAPAMPDAAPKTADHIADPGP